MSCPSDLIDLDGDYPFFGLLDPLFEGLREPRLHGDLEGELSSSVPSANLTVIARLSFPSGEADLNTLFLLLSFITEARLLVGLFSNKSYPDLEKLAFGFKYNYTDFIGLIPVSFSSFNTSSILDDVAPRLFISEVVYTDPLPFSFIFALKHSLNFMVIPLPSARVFYDLKLASFYLDSNLLYFLLFTIVWNKL